MDVMRRKRTNFLVALLSLLTVATAALWITSFFSVSYFRVSLGGGSSIDASSNCGTVRFRLIADPDKSRIPEKSWLASASPFAGETTLWRQSALGVEVGSSHLWGYMLGTNTYFIAASHLSLIAFFGITTGGLLYLRFRRAKPGHCARCGYDLRATPDRCPECGMPAQPGVAAA